MRRKEKRLYRGREGAESRERIERYYERRGESPARARESYGAIVGKVKRERLAEEDDHPRSRGSTHEVDPFDRDVAGHKEHVRGHRARNPRR